jgi:hypothetical protein
MGFFLVEVIVGMLDTFFRYVSLILYAVWVFGYDGGWEECGIFSG